jgi:hypothetical protein
LELIGADLFVPCGGSSLSVWPNEAHPTNGTETTVFWVFALTPVACANNGDPTLSAKMIPAVTQQKASSEHLMPEAYYGFAVPAE